jgi:hypothetical protein
LRHRFFGVAIAGTATEQRVDCAFIYHCVEALRRKRRRQIRHIRHQPFGTHTTTPHHTTPHHTTPITQS